MELNGDFAGKINWNKTNLFSTFKNIWEIEFQLFVKKLCYSSNTSHGKVLKYELFNQLFTVSRSKECCWSYKVNSCTNISCTYYTLYIHVDVRDLSAYISGWEQYLHTQVTRTPSVGNEVIKGLQFLLGRLSN